MYVKSTKMTLAEVKEYLLDETPIVSHTLSSNEKDLE